MAVTKSEMYLEQMARKSFLSMWSYPNPAFGNPASSRAGKELCDLLVLFQNNVLLFSDKSCAYPDGADRDLNWNRWYKRSILKSIDQLVGAKKTLSQSIHGLFTDTTLRKAFPLSLPSGSSARYFLIAVAHESGPQCRLEYGRDSLRLDTRHSQSGGDRLTVGCRFGDHFIHILDDSTLDVVLKHCDTIVDFIDYLERKEEALSSREFVVHGEENLLATYISNCDPQGNHFIPVSSHTPTDIIHDGVWNRLLAAEPYRRSKDENRISYNIDMLIEHFTNSYLSGQMIEGQHQPLSHHERALRMMASENRFGRRTISTALVSILQEEATTTFWAVTVPSFATASLRYVFLTYPEPPNGIGLEECEKFVLEHLTQHLLVARYSFPESSDIIGIAVPNRVCKMTSHFIRILDGKGWTDNDYYEAAQLQHATGIFANMEEERYIHFE